MSGKYVLAIDAGSGGGRVLITDLRGQAVSTAYHKWTYDTPAELAPMGKEFDPGEFWDAICQVIAEAIGKSGIARSDITAVSVASQREGVVFLDRDGHELYAGPNTDLRALSEGFSIDAEFGREIYDITGHTPSLLFTPAKLRWFEANRPHIYERIATVLSISDWVVYRLCGQRVGEVSSDSDTGLVDIFGRCWSPRLLDMLHVPDRVCPQMVAAGTCVGEVTTAAARQTGLAPSTLVVMGGADTQCGLLGMGVRDGGQVGIVAGWSAAIQMVTAEPIIDPRGRIWASCHILPGKWVVESNATESGGSYQWLSELMYGASDSAEETYAAMDRLAREVPPGAEGVVAYIGPRAMDMTCLSPSLGGLIFPITPSVMNIERRHLIRAALENLCFAFRANCNQLEEVSGLAMKDVSIGGGLAQSRSLVQILSDVIGMPVICFDMPEVTSMGAAMCAAVGSGTYPDLENAAEAMRPEARIVEPDSASAREYVRCYDMWLSTGKWLEDLSNERGHYVGR